MNISAIYLENTPTSFEFWTGVEEHVVRGFNYVSLLSMLLSGDNLRSSLPTTTSNRQSSFNSVPTNNYDARATVLAGA